MLKIRRPLGRLIFNMGIAIPGKTVFLIETAPSPFSIFKAMRHWFSHRTGELTWKTKRLAATSWWRHGMETLAALLQLLALCEGNPSVSRPVIWSFEFSLLLSWMSYQTIKSHWRWFETKLHSCDVIVMLKKTRHINAWLPIQVLKGVLSRIKLSVRGIWRIKLNGWTSHCLACMLCTVVITMITAPRSHSNCSRGGFIFSRLTARALFQPVCWYWFVRKVAEIGY